MKFKYKVGDLVEYKDNPLLHLPLHLPLHPHPLRRLNKTLGLILKKLHCTEIYDPNPPKGYDKPTEDYNAYEWYSVLDSETYLIYEFECEKVKV